MRSGIPTPMNVIGRLTQKIRICKLLKRTWRQISVREERKYVTDTWLDYLYTVRSLTSWQSSTLPHDKNTSEVLIISMSNMPGLIKMHALIGTLFRLTGYQPVIVTGSRSHWAKRYFPIFGIDQFVFWDDWVATYGPSSELVEEHVNRLFSPNTSIKDIKNWELNGVSIGKHALSSATRQRMAGQFDLTLTETRELFLENLRKAIQSTLAAEVLFKQRPIKKLIVRDSGYVPNGGIYEMGLACGVDCIRAEMAQQRESWIFKRYSPATRGESFFSISQTTWDRLRDCPLTEEQEAALWANFDERYNPSSTKDVYRYQKGKQLQTPDDIYRTLSLDSEKKTAVIFSHITWDASFFDGEDLYTDYEEWLVETARLAYQNPHLNWIIKLHPANLVKLDDIEQATEINALAALGPRPSHVHLMRADTPVNTRSLFEVMNYGLTVRGTIGMELPCFGIPVLTGGTGRYDRYGFTIDSDSIEAYEEHVRNLHKYPPLSDQEIQLAQRHAYWTLVRRQTPFSEIITMPNKWSNLGDSSRHPLRYNVAFKVQTATRLSQTQVGQRLVEWINSDESDFII